jgi:hypothetical protein
MPDPIRCPLANALDIEHDGKQFGTYVATVPPSHTLDDVLTPEYFGRMQSRGQTDRLLRAGDFIDVRSEDFSWYVRLMVRACLPTVDKVITAAIMPPVVFDAGEIPAGWSMEYKGAERKWTICYNDVEKAALFRTPEEARARIIELAGEPEQKPKNKGGRPPKAKAEAETAKEPEPA